jgi:hypothetical protein
MAIGYTIRIASIYFVEQILSTKAYSIFANIEWSLFLISVSQNPGMSIRQTGTPPMFPVWKETSQVSDQPSVPTLQLFVPNNVFITLLFPYPEFPASKMFFLGSACFFVLCDWG